ncbi:MAG: response regulator [Acidobacteriota bacterium]
MAKKILLADDSLTIQKVVELTFSDSDYELVCVSNGQRALERVREDRPDLILADAVMPEKNGYEVCEAIKGDPATARIPVVLLSGTFEPFDRERAERIGADAIVSKPFDSHQLLAQVDALLEGPRHGRQTDPEGPRAPARTVPPTPEKAAPAPAPPAPEEAPFDEGFSEGDFTASVRLPPSRAGVDPFEEDYGRGDVDSAIEAFEKAHPRFGFGSALESAPSAAAPEPVPESAREPQWLGEDAYPAGAPAASGLHAGEPSRSASTPDASDDNRTVAISRDELEQSADEMPTMEFTRPKIDRGSDKREPSFGDRFVPFGGPMGHSEDFGGSVPAAAATTEISAQDAEVLFDIDEEPAPAAQEETSDGDRDGDRDTEPAWSEPEPPPPEAEELPATAHAAEEEPSESRFGEPSASEPGAGAVPGEIEMLAQRSSIPELTQMLSSVRSGGDMSEEQIERLATRVVEKLSDRIVREIAWEVIPDMAELVIKQRIKELEAGVE